MHPAIIIGIVRSLIVDVAMGQIPRSTERISSLHLNLFMVKSIPSARIGNVSDRHTITDRGRGQGANPNVGLQILHFYNNNNNNNYDNVCGAVITVMREFTRFI